MTDVLLLKKISNGDRSAYNEIFDRYFDRLQAFASNMVFRDDVAADIVQDMLIKLYEKPVPFTDISSLRSYMFTTIRNRCYNYLRDHKVEDKRMLLYVQAITLSGNVDVAEHDDALADMDMDDVMRGVEQIIALLPEKCRDICRMRFLERRKYTDIAVELNISENTVRVQIHRGMERIRKHFSDINFVLLLFVISLLG